MEAILQWEITSEDFVYCVALSHDMQYVAYGGTAKKACVLSARSGTSLLEIPLTGVIWSVALFDTASSGWQLAIGGELPVISVVALETQTDTLQLPVTETTFDLAMTAESLIFANGTRATMFGAGGSH